MVGVHLHSLYRRRRRRNKIPILSAVSAAPETRGVRIHGLGVARIKGKEVYDSPQIEHPPRAAAVVRDVGAAHVAGNKDSVGVMRTDGGVEHRPAATRADHVKIAGPLRRGAGEAQEYCGCDQNWRLHLFVLEERLCLQVFRLPAQSLQRRVSASRT
jgi:hypothetical protein